LTVIKDSLIIADLDLLKNVNDKFGHPSGDLAIKHIANVMKLNVRDVDTVGRFGGEEFVVLLPETEHTQARMVADRICSGIRDKPVEGVGTITASLGLATYPQDATDYNKLFELADQALLLAKRKGRNQVRSASEEVLPASSDNLPAVNERSMAERPIADRSERSIPALAAQALKALPEPTINAINLTLVARRGLLGLLSLLAKAIEEMDMYEPGRTEDVYNYARKMAESLNMPADKVEMISLAAVYSNLGKLILPKEILKKEGPLTAQEMEIVKSHPSAGARLLETAKLVVRMAPVVEAYQENWDGTGYPLGLKGEDIPLESRIVAIVNDYVAMISNRPYRAGLSEEEALRIIEEKSGKDYDPKLAELFLSLLGHDARIAKV
jgi:diguanylate cyclase (GGDEF)-like protein